MKKIFFKVILGLFFTAMSESVVSQHLLDFTLINSTGEHLYGMYVSEVDNDSWGNDILPKDIIENGAEVEVKFTDNGDITCKWDIKITKDPSEENYVVIEDVNLCNVAKLTLFKKDGKYIYVAE